MAPRPESPRFILVIGGLFLIAYAAYQVGSSWMTALSSDLLMPSLTQPYPAPELTSIPLEPYPAAEDSGVPQQPYPDSEPTNTPPQAYPDVAYTNTPSQPYPGVEFTSTPLPPYPDPEISYTPTTTPILTATPTPIQTTTPTPSQPTLTPTLENFPTTTPEDDGYPGPEQTSTPITGDPYPGPEQTSTPTIASEREGTPTPTLTPTSLSNTPTVRPTQTEVPTLGSTPTPITALSFSEIQIIADGPVNQAVWLNNESDLALATLNGLIFHRLEDEAKILDDGYPILSVVYKTGDDQIAAGGGDSLIRLWDLSSGTFIKYLSGHMLGVVRLSYSPARGLLASASDDATVRIWDDRGILLNDLRGPNTRVVDMAISLNGQLVAAASNQHVHIWNPQSGDLLHTISQPEGWFTALAFHPNSQVFVTAYEGGRLEFWDTITWERRNFIPLQVPVQSLVYHPYGRVIAVGYKDGRIQIWDTHHDYLLADLSGHQGLTSMAFNPYEDQLVTSSLDGSIRIWDLAQLINP
jgi:WD40 repeat protein